MDEISGRRSHLRLLDQDLAHIFETKQKDTDFLVRFWGVRGSIPVCDPNTVGYGGNTSCLEIRCKDRLIILDAGSGLRYFGDKLTQQGKTLEADLFLTHAHYDHICGIPFFGPFFNPNNTINVWSGDLSPVLSSCDIFKELMTAPLFPVPPSIFQATINYQTVSTGSSLDLGDGITIHTAPLNHPNGATGYRVEFNGKSICYITDTEHPAEGVDENIRALVQDADICIYDAMYTEAEYQNCVGFGHSTWQAGAALCDAANVKTYVAFHHEPSHDDDFMDQVARELEARRPGSVVAREGMALKP